MPLNAVHPAVGLGNASASQQPAWTLRHAAPESEHNDADGQPREECQPPSQCHREEPAGKKDARCPGTDDNAEPEGAVDGDVHSAAKACRDQLIDSRVHRRILTADTGAGEKAADSKACQAPRGAGLRPRPRDIRAGATEKDLVSQ